MSALFLEPTPKQQFHDVLLAHLLAVEARFWPGGDGLTLEEVLETYPLQVRVGSVPDEQALIVLYPELAAEVRAFFAECQHPFLGVSLEGEAP